MVVAKIANTTKHGAMEGKTQTRVHNRAGSVVHFILKDV